MSRILLICSCLILVVGCSSFDVINGVTGSSQYEVIRDVRYGPTDRQFLDLYLPNDVLPDAPVLVFFYGGGWKDGAKADYEFVASVLTEKGIVVALPDYRLFSTVKFPTFVEDGALALQWMDAHLADYGLSGKHRFVGGHSAGAHIAALLSFDERYLGEARKTIDGFIGLSGPYDFLPIESGYLLDVFPAGMREASQPINFVSAAAPATLLIHGDDDDTVGIENSERLAQALIDAGVHVTFTRYEGVGHARVVAAMASPLSKLAPTANDISAYILTESAAN